MVVFEDVGIIDKLKIELKNPEQHWYAGWTMEKVSFYSYEFGNRKRNERPGYQALRRRSDLRKMIHLALQKSRKASISMVLVSALQCIDFFPVRYFQH